MSYRTLLLTSPNMTGTDVKSVQGRLGLPQDGVYGPLTGNAVKAWRWRTGFPTAVTGLGPDGQRIILGIDPLPLAYRVRAKLRAGNKPPVTVSALALQTMLGWAHAGLTEHPPQSNKVPQLAAVAKGLGLSAWYQAMGWPWCAFSAMLAARLHDGATSHAGFAGKFNVLYVPTILNEARARRNGLMTVSRADVEPGDLAIFNFDGGVPDHIGRVVQARAADCVTVEGNTSSAGSQNNGGSVLVKTRGYSLIQAFARDS